MDISDLNRDQQVTLVGLLETVAMSDGGISEGEELEIGRVAAELGEEAYRRLLEEADERFPDVDALQDALGGIEDQGARELIYGLAMEELMSSPGDVHERTDLLDWLAGEWNIRVADADAP